RKPGRSCGALPWTTTVLLRLPRSNSPIRKKERLAQKLRTEFAGTIASAMGSFGHVAFFGQPARCEVAHTSLPIRHSKVCHRDICRAARRGTWHRAAGVTRNK